jgi:hypothetical protein
MKKNNGVRDAGNGRPGRSSLHADGIFVGATVLGRPRVSPKSYHAAVVFATFIVPLFLYCIYPVYDGEMDIEEQQSVWQYLNVYSIYQDRLPDECGDNTPSQLFNMISDTLKGGRYTGYYKKQASGTETAGLSASQANNDQWLKITDSTAYIRISEFSETALDNFNAWRKELERFPNIVIDLRDNGGGLLYVTDSIVGEFIPYNTEFIKNRYRDYDSKDLRGITVDWINRKSVKRNPRLTNKNLSVIINGGSASASEILASALKDCANANLIALQDTKSYGKGIGQVTIPRSGRDMLIITFMQIRGVSERTGDYHRKGIAPDTIPDTLRSEAEDSCLVEIDAGRQVIAQTLYCAVKTLEKSAPSSEIKKAAEIVERQRALRKGPAGPVGVYVEMEPDPLGWTTR